MTSGLRATGVEGVAVGPRLNSRVAFVWIIASRRLDALSSVLMILASCLPSSVPSDLVPLRGCIVNFKGRVW
jgi:hypothetical protein